MYLKKLALVIAAPLALAACDPAMMMNERDEDGRLKNISPAALAALPAGMDPGFLIRDSNGCYGLALEMPVEGTPPTGIALRDAAGNQVCDT